MVMICSIIVLFTEPNVGKYVDPGMSIISATVLLYLKYPNSKSVFKKYEVTRMQVTGTALLYFLNG